MYKLDHIVHFVDSPEEAVKELSAQGLHVVSGGKHEQWGTYNALLFFDTSYIEFIGIYDQVQFKEAAAVPYTLHETYARNNFENGLTRVAISTTTIEEDAERFRSAGFEVIGPDNFSRTRPDGSVVSWRLLHVGEKDGLMDLPFFIQWDQQEKERVKEMKERGIIEKHAAGPLKISEVSYIVSNFEIPRRLLQLCSLEHTFKKDEKMKAEVMTIYTAAGNLVFYRPYEEGEVWDVLMKDGPGLNSVVLEDALEDCSLDYQNGSYRLKKIIHP